MSRSSSARGSRGIQGRKGELWKDVQKELVTARKKAGKKVGGKVVKEQKAKLRSSGAGSRRLKGVRHIAGKDGTLVLLDHAPLATAQEEGETITARGGMLAIGRAGASLGKPGSRIPGAFVMRSKAGNLLLLRKKGKSGLERLAILLRSVRISKSLGFLRRAEAAVGEYVAEVETNLTEGFN